MPEALQVVGTTSSSEDPNENQFILNEDNLNQIVEKIPVHCEVAVVTVVGAFRSGKSFLLNFLLRYLMDGHAEDPSEDWMTARGEFLETDANPNATEDEKMKTKTDGFFSWRGGKDRHTTGIWMWSEPLFRQNPNSGEKMAILLMDTQGMFDNETTMTLTAQIFGLSTLTSSFQIYNVRNLIQENNLGDLALFSEYGRAALEPPDVSDAAASGKKPFQRLQFLVRDWENFDTTWTDSTSEDEKDVIYKQTKAAMDAYMYEVIHPNRAEDLQSTRAQISRCFEQVDCFLLPHPGLDVPEKTYDGAIKSIRSHFRGMLNRYVRLLFDQELEPKSIQGRSIKGTELVEYFKSYVSMFQDSSGAFPEAKTMLAATTEANTNNAAKLARIHYNEQMEKVTKDGFLKTAEFDSIDKIVQLESLKVFSKLATFGEPSSIEKTRKSLEGELAKIRKTYVNINHLRNPFRSVEMYVVPICVAIFSRIAAHFIHFSCDHDVCISIVNNLRMLSFLVTLVLIYLGWNYIKGAVKHLQNVVPLLSEGHLTPQVLITKTKKD
jgi:atlastin